MKYNENYYDFIIRGLFFFYLDMAKNVILFLGDGMSIPTLAATRAYIGQKRNETGEEVYLSFERFPYTALSKVSNDFKTKQKK